MYNVATTRNDTFFISLYALLGGILWDNTDTGGDQSAWAEDTSRNWDAIVHDGGGSPLDASDKNYLGASKIHPATEPDASFFLSYVLAERFAKIASDAEKSIGGSGYMGMSHAGLVQPPKGW
jgi:hypothetical protein